MRAIAVPVLLLALTPLAGRSLASRQARTSSPPAAADTPTFYRDVLPILQQHCQSCHRPGEIAPMPYVTYEQTRPFAGAIAISATDKKMPPWFADPNVGKFSNDPSLTPQEIRILTSWAKSGAPAGNPGAAPPPRLWAEGWNISQPDLVVKMPKPVAIPPRGDVEYTYEIVPSGFTQDLWVQMSEVRPESREHVHHAVVYIRPPESQWLRHAPVGRPFTASDLSSEQGRREARATTSDILLVYAPGSSPDNWPDGMAKLVPAGSDIVFQMHYTTNGHAAHDQTNIGMVFAKKPPAQRVLSLQLTNTQFVIPPGVSDARVEVRGTMPNDALLLSFFPHMHLRGKRFEYSIVHPDGRADGRPGGKDEPLLRVNYDFYWQMSYRLATPIPLKAGTELEADAWYDNSKNNPHNPDPSAAVYCGEQTYDEMMVGFFDVAVPVGIGKPQFFSRNAAHR